MFKLRKVVLVIFLLVGVVAEIVTTHDDEVCIPVRRSTATEDGLLSEPRASAAAGPPGKRGGVGPPGLPGQVGRPGSCACDPSEIQQVRTELIAEIITNKETIANLTQRMSAVIDLQEPIVHAESCRNTAGMQDGRIRDDEITASSSFSNEYLPKYARLDLQPLPGTHDGRWCPRSPYIAGLWIQVDLKTVTTVVAIITQGDPERANGLTRFKIAYGASVGQLEVMQDNAGNDVIFQATPDHDIKTRNDFSPPVSARYIRVITQEHRGDPSLRMEYITC